MPPPDDQRKGDGAFSEYGVAPREMEAWLEICGFDMDAGVEMTMTQAHIDVQKCDFGGGGMPSEFDRIATVEAFKELIEGIGPRGQRRKMSSKNAARGWVSREQSEGNSVQESP